MTTVRQINAAGEALIKSFEGLVLTAAPDMVGVPTVGWGHTGKDVRNGMTITEAHAEALFKLDMRASEAAVTHLVKNMPNKLRAPSIALLPISTPDITINPPTTIFLSNVALTDNQFSALVSLVFNVGAGALIGTHLIADLNAGQFANAADDILRFDHAGGKQVRGLTRRRKAERKLFLTA